MMSAFHLHTIDRSASRILVQRIELRVQSIGRVTFPNAAKRIGLRWCVLVILCSVALAGPAKSAAAKPNFVLLLTDDQSWVGTSLQLDPANPDSKSDYYQTPNIERLARGGMTFSRGYAPAPFCCPTRRSILTGQSPARHVYQKIQPDWTVSFRKQLTIPRLLKQIDSAYRTAHFGKWDMRFDNVTPEEMGYDVSDGLTGNSTGGANGSGGPAPRSDPKLAFSVTSRAIEFMKECAAEEQPFFVQVSHYAVHLDIFYRAESLEAVRKHPIGEKHSLPEFAAMTKDVDDAIGRLLDALEDLQLGSTTYVFFMSDNGGRLTIPGQRQNAKRPRNAPLRNGKGSMYEGGLRVPFVVRGPGIARNSRCLFPVTGLDLLPTIADLAGYRRPLPETLDGGSLVATLKNRGRQPVSRRRPYLVFHQAVARKAQSAILFDRFKLVKTWANDRLELFDITQDIGERHDLAEQQPERVRRLDRLLTSYLNDVGAETRRTTTKQAQKRLFAPPSQP